MFMERSSQDYFAPRRSLFIDKDFPPNDLSLYGPGSFTRDRFQSNVVWKRASELVKNPKLKHHGASRHDLDQGSLGDCWFVASAAVLATSHPNLMARVVPDDQGFERGRYTGLFRFNFWRYGNWTEVVVDDYLPTDGRQPIYCRNRERPDEFWPCLLEKAYAKLHGSYQALAGGHMQDAMVDMTGGISEAIDLQEKNEVYPWLYSLMMKSFHMKTLMGVALFHPSNVEGRNERMKPNGLCMGHAYSITDLKPILRGTVKLVRLRNPWGRREWNGAWSDKINVMRMYQFSSSEMRNLSRELKESLNYKRLDDGEFWISYDDLLHNADLLQMCHLSPDALFSELADNDDKQQWNVEMFHGQWIQGVTAGGCGNSPYKNLMWKNPQFYVTLQQMVWGHGHDCTMIVSLMKKAAREKKSIAIGFHVYMLKDGCTRPLDGVRASQSVLEFVETTKTLTYDREMTMRFQLKRGTYAIIPYTFNPNEEADFLLRVVTENLSGRGQDSMKQKKAYCAI